MFRLWWSVWHVPLSCLSPVASHWSLCRSGNTSSASLLPFILMFRCLCVQVKPLGEPSPPAAFPQHAAKWTGLVKTRDQEIATCSCESGSSFSFSFIGAWRAATFSTVWFWVTGTWTLNRNAECYFRVAWMCMTQMRSCTLIVMF